MAVATTQLEKLVDVDAHEGPVYVDSEHALYFTTVPRDLRVDVKRLDLLTLEISTVRANANMANGMTLGPDGRLLVCEQGAMSTPARIAALDPSTGETETVVDSYRERPFNSPNDIVVASDGAIWFTDPSYGHLVLGPPDAVPALGGPPGPVPADQARLRSAQRGGTGGVASCRQGDGVASGAGLQPSVV